MLVVNPNFYHPFLQLGGDCRKHTRRLREAQKVFPFDEDKDFYDLLISAMPLKSDLTPLYLHLTQLWSRMGRQYFDHINKSVIQTVIEGGVADGWVSAQFLGSFENAVVYGFDPDRELFQNSYHKPFLLHSRRFHYMPLGLWQQAARLPFHVARTFTSRVTEQGLESADDSIETTAVDDFVAAARIDKVDFIKLDVEGAELDVMRGARQTICNHRPQLAVCVYHKLEHYYEIPLLLSQYTENYIFRIGHYSPFHLFSETVLYGIPRELYYSHPH